MLFWKVMGYNPNEGGKIIGAFSHGTYREPQEPLTLEEEERLRQEEFEAQSRLDAWLAGKESLAAWEAEQRDAAQEQAQQYYNEQQDIHWDNNNGLF